MKNIHILPTDKPSRLYHKNGRFKTDKSAGIDWFISEGYKPRHMYITNDEEIKKGDWCFNPKTNKIIKVGHYGHYGHSSKKIIMTTDQALIADGIQGIDDELLKRFIENPECEFVEISYGLLKPFQSADKGYMIHFPDDDVLEEPGEDYTVVHLRHCYQGEYEDGCKYGEDSCPAKPLEVSEQENCCTLIGQIKRYVDCVGCDRNPEDEMVEEAAQKYLNEKYQKGSYLGKLFIAGAKWQAERTYTEEDMRLAIKKARDISDGKDCFDAEDISGCTEVCTYGWKFNISEDLIIEQFKKK
jgi:hypothetical protein